MIVKVTNLKNYDRQFQFYRTNRYVVIKGFETVIIEDIINLNNSEELTYYNRIIGFKLEEVKQEIEVLNNEVNLEEAPTLDLDVESLNIQNKDIDEDNVNIEENNIIKDTDNDINLDTLSSEELDIKDDDNSDSSKLNLTDYTDIELKEILNNLGIKTKVRSRDKLEELIISNLPEGSIIEEFI